jgi:E3 ubiquitin-protein ligase TRIP12
VFAVDFSSTAFASSSTRVLLVKDQGQKIPLMPSQSIIEVIFEHFIAGDDEEARWKRINEIWSVPIQLEIVDDQGPRSPGCESPKKECESDSFMGDERTRLALDLLNELCFTVPNVSLGAKLAKELDSPLLLAVCGISRHWIEAARKYRFLFSFELRLLLFKSVALGRLRALWNLQQRLGGNSLEVSLISLPRRKFLIHRDRLAEAVRAVLAPNSRGDLRVFEFEYAEELGSGHGPTMEFYALASQYFSNGSFVVGDDDGRSDFFTDCAQPINIEHLNLLGSFVARAWLDDRIINVPLQPQFISLLKRTSNQEQVHYFSLEDLSTWLGPIDRCENLEDAQVSFVVPGASGEIPLIPGGQDRLIRNPQDLAEFKTALLDRINANARTARAAFIDGFNSAFPCPFETFPSAFFSNDEICRLVCASSSCDDDNLWSVEAIGSALLADHGYRPDSPQIIWLAQVLAEISEDSTTERIKLVRFLTGAAYLPIGGWKALKPPLTIVCKTFSTEQTSIATSTSTATSNENITSPISTTSSTSSHDNNHDIYLPSVMTCANYLKLPRYSSKEILKERLLYAIKEGSESFYLS